MSTESLFWSRFPEWSFDFGSINLAVPPAEFIGNDLVLKTVRHRYIYARKGPHHAFVISDGSLWASEAMEELLDSLEEK